MSRHTWQDFPDQTTFTVRAGWCPLCRGRCFEDHNHTMADMDAEGRRHSRGTDEAGFNLGMEHEHSRLRPLLERCEEVLAVLRGHELAAQDIYTASDLCRRGLLVDLRRELGKKESPPPPCSGSGTIVSAMLATKACPECGAPFRQIDAGPAVGLNLWAIPVHQHR